MADFLKIDDILKNIDLRNDMKVAEFGCGSAIFAINIAKKANKGRVFALDIQEEKLSALNGRLKHQKINNVFTILCDLEAEKGSTLPNDSIDLVLMPNILFQAEDRYAIIKESDRILKHKGQLLIIDWLKKSPFGPEQIISPDEVKKIAEEVGFSFKKELISGDYHYVLLFIKK